MKKLIALFVMTASAVLWGAGDDQEQVSVVIGDTIEVAATFPIQEVRCESTCVKLRRSGNKSYNVMGVSAGTAIVELMGTDNIKSYSVTVVDALQPIIKALGRDLEEVPEVEIMVNNGKICLRGEISKTEHWDLYHLVLSRYQQYCFDYVVFTPGKDLLAKFGKILEQSGYRMVTEATSDNPGCIEMKYAGGVMTITGYFFNKKDVAEVEKIVGRQTWLAMTGGNTRAGSVPCITNFYVVDRLIDVGVVFLTISKNAIEAFGNSGAVKGELGNFEMWTQLMRIFGDADPDGNANLRTARLGFTGGVNGMLNFLASNGLATHRKSGHVTFNSNGEKAAKATFQDGGTLMMKVTGVNGGNVKEVSYGFKITVEGVLTHADEVKLDLDLEDSGNPQPSGDDYTQSKVAASMPVVACLGETIAIGGSHKVSHTETPPSGFAVLRYIPIVSWFTSYGQENVSDDYTLVLISPEYADEFDPLRRRPSEETGHLERTASRELPKAVKERIRQSDPWYKVFYFWRWFEEDK